AKAPPETKPPPNPPPPPMLSEMLLLTTLPMMVLLLPLITVLPLPETATAPPPLPPWEPGPEALPPVPPVAVALPELATLPPLGAPTSRLWAPAPPPLPPLDPGPVALPPLPPLALALPELMIFGLASTSAPARLITALIRANALKERNRLMAYSCGRGWLFSEAICSFLMGGDQAGAI